MNTRAGWYSLFINIFLLALNLAMAAFSGSLALAAETAHNLLDLVASGAVLIGLTLSRRRSRAFPYGLYKVENVVAVFIALTTFFTGYEIAKEALFAAPRAPDVRPVMLGGVLLAALIPLVFSQYEMRLGRAVNSPSLIADATEFRAHILSSGVVFAALAGQLLGLPLDRAAALVIVLWIAHAGWGTLVEGMRVLLDASLDRGTLMIVRKLIAAQPEVASIKTLTGRNSGRYRFIEAEVTLHVADLEHAHRVATRLEDVIRAEVPHVERVLIHTEPAAKEVLRVAIPLERVGDGVAAEFGAAPRFALCDVRSADEALVRQEEVVNPQAGKGKGRGIKTAEWLVAQRADVVVTRAELAGKGSGYVLQAAGVRMIRTDAATLADALTALAS
jgi:cation diffusion facilitator family transporter